MLGERVNYYTDMIGLLPMKSSYSDMFHDFVLSGKLVFYEKGLIFVDNRVYCLAISYEDLDEINFYSVKYSFMN